jgi:hypothetical protein
VIPPDALDSRMAIDGSKTGGIGPAASVFRLGEEPRDDLRATTTAEERIELLRALSERAWRLTGRSVPAYSRGEIPIQVTRSG